MGTEYRLTEGSSLLLASYVLILMEACRSAPMISMFVLGISLIIQATWLFKLMASESL